MADRNSWIHGICRFLTYCRRTMAGGVVSSQHFGENLVHFPEVPERVVGLIHGNREMPHKCRLFLGFVNILTVAVVVGLAMEGTSPDGPQSQQQQDDDDQADWSTVKERDRNTQHDIPSLPVGDSQLPRIKADVEKPETSKGQERPETSRVPETSKGQERPETSRVPERNKGQERPETSRVPETNKGQERPETSRIPETSKGQERPETSIVPPRVPEKYNSVCDYCTASGEKANRLLTEFGYFEGEEHTERSKSCRCRGGGVQTSKEANHGDRVNLESVHTTLRGHPEGAAPGAAQGESVGCSRHQWGDARGDAQDEDQRHPVQNQVTLYWRNRVLDILAPSLEPLPDLFNDFGNMNESGHNTGGKVGEGDQSHNECGGSEEENVHESSRRFHDVENNEAATDSVNNLETILENEDNLRDNQDAIQRERAGMHGMDQCYDESSPQDNQDAIQRARAGMHGMDQCYDESSPRYNQDAIQIAGFGMPEMDQFYDDSSPRDDQDAIQRARVGMQEMDQCYDESSATQQNSRQIRVEIQLPAPVLLPQPRDDNSEYPESGTVFPSRPVTPPTADRHDSRSTSPMRRSRSLVVIYTPISAPTVTTQPEFSSAEYYDAQPEFNNAPLPEYYDSNRDPNFIDAFSGGGNTGSGPPQYSSSDDDEVRSQPSSSLSSRSWSTPVPSDRPHLHTNSSDARERLRPRGRALARRPRCGLRMMKALRDDPSCIPEEGKTTRQPGREDKFFKPRTGDVICRHTVVPGRGAVEIYLPGTEEHLQDGDSLVRLKMDNTSYPTMLILSAKAHLFLQGKWIYVGRHQHGVRKPKREWLPG